MNDFKIGDLVRQKGSYAQMPTMTINYVFDDGVKCTYWQPITQTFVPVEFHPAELEKVG